MKLIKEQDEVIEVENKGILEVPEGKKVDELPLSHFKRLVDKKGYAEIIRALNNLAVWNKNDDKQLSEWAKRTMTKLRAIYRKDECIKRGTISTIIENVGNKPKNALVESDSEEAELVVKKDENTAAADEKDDKTNAADDKVPSSPRTEEDMGIATMLNKLIIDEFEAIDGYQSTIASLNAVGGYEEIVKVLEEISNDEYMHVGNLQQVLKLVDPQVDSIESGKEEATETIDNN